MNKKEYDIIVIGAGSGGLNVAVFMNSIGLKVLLVDKSDAHIGGDCLNTGCVPSKALIHAARLCKDAQLAEEFGISTDGVADLKKVMAHVHGAQETIREHENAEHFRALGIDVVLGEASFVSKDTITVAGKEYKGRKMVIATGSRPRELSITGTEEVKKAGKMYTSENIFSMQELPKKLLVIGAGPIGIELGQAFQFLGSEVTVVTNDNKILGKEDQKIASILKTQLEKDGITFLLNKDTQKFEGESTLVIADNETKEESKLEFDAVLVSIGRILNTESLSLEKAGIKTDERNKIVVNNRLQTTNKNIFVCGDVAGQHQFTHAAEMHAGLLIRNFLTPFFKKKLSTDTLSWVTYTTPEVATYGLGEVELAKRNILYQVLETSFEDDDRAITDSAEYGHTKMFIDAKSKKILGGTMVAPHAGELVQELILATSNDLKIDDIFYKTYPYPTAARINKSLATKHFKTKLTPFNKSLLKKLFKLGL